ncbi:MAG: permease [Candidatus Aminicenantes bacterium]|nr:MAG: permease [Candidatus Aminicenantes bacterium]
MTKKRRISNMFIPTLVMAFLAVVLLIMGYSKGEGQHIAGLKSALKMTTEILPLLVFAFIMAGMIQVLLPQELLSKWIGEESGIRGILLGTLAGGITPGGPYVSLPLAAGFLRAGAGIGTMVAFLTAWSLWAVARMPMEIGIMGWKFTFVRLACTFFFPPIAGFLAQMFFSGFK